MSEKRLFSLAFVAATAFVAKPAHADIPAFPQIPLSVRQAIPSGITRRFESLPDVPAVPRLQDGIEELRGSQMLETINNVDVEALYGQFPRITEGVRQNLGGMSRFPEILQEVRAPEWMPSVPADLKAPEWIPMPADLKAPEWMPSVPADLKAPEWMPSVPADLKAPEWMPSLQEVDIAKTVEDVRAEVPMKLPASDWRGYLPKDLDWRSYLPDDFAWGKFIPADFDWQKNLPKTFPDVPTEALDWEKFVRFGFDWPLFKMTMEQAWTGAMGQKLVEKFPQFGGKPWIIANGGSWAQSLKEFFTFQRVAKADFDWRQYITPGFDMKQLVKPGYDVSVLFPKDFDWRAKLPMDFDWRPFLPLDFDWKNFLITDKFNIFPVEIDWNMLIPKQLPAKFDWKPFFLSALRWNDFLPREFYWKQLIPVGDSWVDSWKDFDWEDVSDWMWSIPAEFQWKHYAQEVMELFESFAGKFATIPEDFVQFVAQLKGIIQWSNYKESFGNLKGAVAVKQPVQILAALETLKIDPKAYYGGVDQLQVAYFKQFAETWFLK